MATPRNSMTGGAVAGSGGPAADRLGRRGGRSWSFAPFLRLRGAGVDEVRRGRVGAAMGVSIRADRAEPAKGHATPSLQFEFMPEIASEILPNGLPLHRVALEGTRAVTLLVAFDAGARTERPEENGMAHFLEHLVFKGGEKFDDYRAVNETAERLGAVLNAFTSHDLVAFHITARAEKALEAADLLTDFVGRARVDADELDRERGVVIQEIHRSNDQPSMVAEHLIDEATFGNHPLGRPVLGPEEHLRTFSRDGIVAFRERQWSGRHAGAFLVGNLDALPANGEVAELFGRFRRPAGPAAVRARAAVRAAAQVERRDSNQSHLR